MSRISTSSWSLHRALGRPPLFGPGQSATPPAQEPSISLLELPAALATAGIHTLEIVHFHFPRTDEAYIAELGSALDGAGVELFSVLIDAGDITHPDPDTRAQEMAWIRDWLDITAQCGASHARVVGGYQPVERNGGPISEHPVIRRSAQGLGQLAEYAGAQGVRVITENFRETTNRADQVLAILALCGGDVGLCADFGNYRGRTAMRSWRPFFPKPTPPT